MENGLTLKQVLSKEIVFMGFILVFPHYWRSNFYKETRSYLKGFGGEKLIEENTLLWGGERLQVVVWRNIGFGPDIP